ncbi:MAG: 50S ribosomal protein L6 [Nanoarchaeota archaeon]|nr:50S ribosomal protein L6 [Nanoarchaeota archaeon]MBU1028298.1 50S ribosomal protein L6 [Nanoarchaeota archaeon]
MKKKFYQEIEIPEGVEANLEDSTLIVKGPEGENKREFEMANLEFKKQENKILVGHKKTTKHEKKKINTIAAHIKNMIHGVQEKFEYKLKVCFSHFPMNVELKGNEVILKNFLGEKIPRKFKIPEGVEVKIDKEIITIISPNKELGGQAAANFETATKIRGRDKRVFQDGIYITNKGGKEI